MAARSADVRPIIKLRSTAGTGYTYVTRKNRRNAPGRLRDAAKLPRDSAAARVRDRDQVDGRPRGRVGQAGLSSIRSRQATHDGHLPGTYRASPRQAGDSAVVARRTDARSRRHLITRQIT